jgi:hypothetical protein
MNDNQLNLMIRQLQEAEAIIEKLSNKVDVYKMGCLVLGSMVIILILFK